MKRQRPMIVAFALVAGLAAAGAAQAHGSRDVQWSVTIGAPAVVLPRVVLPAPPLPHVRVQPVVVTQPGYRGRTRWDVDGDGIPNRHDRVYNPRWDMDGDGIPNRYDRHPQRPDHRGGHRGHDRSPGYDRDRDGIPDRSDRYPSDPRRGR